MQRGGSSGRQSSWAAGMVMERYHRTLPVTAAHTTPHTQTARGTHSSHTRHMHSPKRAHLGSALHARDTSSVTTCSVIHPLAAPGPGPARPGPAPVSQPVPGCEGWTDISASLVLSAHVIRAGALFFLPRIPASPFGDFRIFCLQCSHTAAHMCPAGSPFRA